MPGRFTTSPPQDRVLEIGCGTASTALRLAPHVTHITASDTSSEMVEIAREKAWNDSVKNITPVQGHIADAALRGPYDAVLAFNLLHLLPDLQNDLAHIHASLQPGGRFISKTPCMGERNNWLKPIIWVMQKLGRAPFVDFLTVDRLEAAIRNAGFDLVETGDYPKKLPSHFVVAVKR